MKFGARDLRVITLNNCDFLENRRRKGRNFLTTVNEITFTSANPSGVLKMKIAGSNLGTMSQIAAFQVVLNPRDHETDVIKITHESTHTFNWSPSSKRKKIKLQELHNALSSIT